LHHLRRQLEIVVLEEHHTRARLGAVGEGDPVRDHALSSFVLAFVAEGPAQIEREIGQRLQTSTGTLRG